MTLSARTWQHQHSGLSGEETWGSIEEVSRCGPKLMPPVVLLSAASSRPAARLGLSGRWYPQCVPLLLHLSFPPCALALSHRRG